MLGPYLAAIDMGALSGAIDSDYWSVVTQLCALSGAAGGAAGSSAVCLTAHGLAISPGGHFALLTFDPDDGAAVSWVRPARQVGDALGVDDGAIVAGMSDEAGYYAGVRLLDVGCDPDEAGCDPDGRPLTYNRAPTLPCFSTPGAAVVVARDAGGDVVTAHEAVSETLGGPGGTAHVVAIDDGNGCWQSEGTATRLDVAWDYLGPWMADVDGSGAVDQGDLDAVLLGWGGGGVSDLDGDGLTGQFELDLVILHWGTSLVPDFQ